MRTDIIISGNQNDRPHLKAFTDSTKHKTSIKSFKLAFGSEDKGVRGEVGILIVNNMLLTRFNAPLEQVMYLDRVVGAYNLLQAIARVNRIAGEDKIKCFVIDYVIVHELAHLIEANHTPRFWNIVRTQVPTTEKAKSWLESATEKG